MSESDSQSKLPDAKRSLLEAETLARQSRYEDARPNFQSALEQFKEAGDPGGQGRALLGLANIARQVGTGTNEDGFDAFYRMAQEAKPFFEAAGDKSGLARCLRYISILQPPDLKRQFAVQSLSLCKEVNDQLGVAESLRLISQLPDTENPEETRNQAIQILRTIGAPRQLATHLWGAAVANSAEDKYEPALRLAGEARMLYRKTGDRMGEMRALHMLAFIAEQLGTEQTPDFHREAIELAREMGHEEWEANGYFHLIRLAREHDDTVEVASLESESAHLKELLAKFAKN